MTQACDNHGNFHRHSLTITLLMISEAQQRRYQTGLEHPAYEVIERAMALAGYSDEKKADLYARMAERVDPRQPLAVVQRVVSDCLFENDREER